MQSGYLKNFSYLFVPFTVEETNDFENFYKRITESNGWKAIPLENRYLHRYVIDKLSWNSNNDGIHFQLDPQFAQAHGLALDTAWYGLDSKKYMGQTDVAFPFNISNVELFAFNTSVCVLAFELRFQDDDPYKIAAAQYFLRKISTEKIYRMDSAENAQGESFVDISGRLLADAAKDLTLDFFFYATPKNEKANFLTYIDVPAKESYEKELFYLKWCYNDQFQYTNAISEDDSENYWASASTLWGISVSAAVCLVIRSETQAAFLENTFQKNFKKQYLLTYILLLHQKYMMYLFSTKRARGLEDNLAELEKYKAQLYDFETHYMFSYISEVPQYQNFYKKVRKWFCLDALFRDVQEPLVQLTEIKKDQKDKAQREYDDRINTALTILSLLTIVSALTDAAGITSDLGWLIPSEIAKIIQLVALSGVAVLSIIMICRLIFTKKK